MKYKTFLSLDHLYYRGKTVTGEQDVTGCRIQRSSFLQISSLLNATQAAMKILINAAYGYMGAGSMALFADMHAADEVTRRGREVLAQVLAALREKGMALIEADTDGVYFAVPASWTEEQERQLVADIGAELPAGIRLEYEGRYRAMFSHEFKPF